MRTIRVWRAATISAAVLAAMAAVAAQPDAGAVAKISAIQNVVETRAAGAAQWASSTRNQDLVARDRVRTGAASRAAILYADDTVHRLNEKSEIEILPPEGGNPGLLKVVSGQHYFSSRKPKDFGRVETATVTAAIKGTEFVVDVGADGTTTITMIEGIVQASNSFGSVDVSAGERALVEPGKAPVRSVVVRPRDAATWALYYPPVLGGADAQRLASSGRDGADLTRASELLSTGQVGEARPLIEGVRARDSQNPVALALASVVALTEDRTADARALAEAAVAADESSAAAALAMSFSAQADFDIERAGRMAERAAELDPEGPEALARAAEMRMAQGDLEGARRLAERAVSRDPGHARALSVLGFVDLSELRTADAAARFERAVEADPGLSLARLGMGIAQIRLGNVDAGREQLQTAVALDPANSLLRSYLGKAYYEEKRSREAGKEFDAAKDLDPSDPTPWLYNALRLQNDNRPVEALDDVLQSIELNDRRAVYRSRLLLDEDRAVRSADLARVFNDLGFEQLGLVTARRSADDDHANHSSHLFLAGNYRDLPEYAPAFLSEVLQGRIYQPVSVNAVRPDVVNGSASFNEYTALFDRPRLRAFGGVAYGETDTDLEDLIPDDATCFDPEIGEVPCRDFLENDSSNAGGFELTTTANGDRYAAALSYRSAEDDGFRYNADQDTSVFRGFVQYAVTPRDTVQLNALIGDRETGDLPFRQYAVVLSPERYQTDETNIGFGWHRRLSAESDLAVSAIYNDTEQTGSNLFFPENRSTSRLKGPQVEAQYVRRQNRITWVAGAGAFEGNAEVFGGNPLVPLSPTIEGDDSFLNGYLYAKFRALGPLQWTAGASVENVDAPVGLFTPRDSFIGAAELSYSDTRVSPKLGATLALASGTTLRAAAYHRLNPAIGRLQTLEPTQVSGFNQFFEDPGGSRSWNYGVGVDQSFGSRWFLGASYLRRDLDIPEAYCESPDRFSGCAFQTASVVENRESTDDVLSAYVNATIGRRLAAAVEYDYTDSQFDYTAVNQIGLFQDAVQTQRLRPELRLFLPMGLFARLAATNYDQEVQQYDDLESSARQVVESSFWITDLSVGYRLPKRWGSVVVDVRNLTDEEFEFFERSIQDRVVPARQVLARLELTY